MIHLPRPHTILTHSVADSSTYPHSYSDPFAPIAYRPPSLSHPLFLFAPSANFVYEQKLLSTASVFIFAL